MITGLDRLTITVGGIESAAADYSAVLGRQAEIEQDGPAAGQARLQLANTALVLHPAGPAAAEPGPDEMLKLVFAADDLEATARRLARRGIAGTRQPDGSIELDRAATHGVAMAITAGDVVQVCGTELDDITGLDHVVVKTPDPERAVALYGGRLGLDLRLDRTNPAFSSRMLFFVCGGVVVEITHDTRPGLQTGADRIFGLAWRSSDLDRAHARMSAAGIALSEIRTGRRPGSRVFTVKSHTAGIPTLVIGGDGLDRS